MTFSPLGGLTSVAACGYSHEIIQKYFACSCDQINQLAPCKVAASNRDLANLNNFVLTAVSGLENPSSTPAVHNTHWLLVLSN